MKIIEVEKLKGTPREVRCPKGGFVSLRALIEEDKMGFSLHKTLIPAGLPQHWHYRNHLEACYCIKGIGLLENLRTGDKHHIVPGILYVLDEHDDHLFQAIEPVELISVFNPPLKGLEVHREDGSYE